MKVDNKKNIVIGIPAFNEERNIGFLLQDIFLQKKDHYNLLSVIIYDDKSTDRTTEIVKENHNPAIQLIENSSRKGKSAGLNTIKLRALREPLIDVLILLDADIKLSDTSVLNSIAISHTKEAWDLFSGQVRPRAPQNILGKILLVSRNLIKHVSEYSTNALCFDGKIIGLSKKLAAEIVWPEDIAGSDDMYSYFFCKKKELKVFYDHHPCISYTLPANFKDHTKQSKRFLFSKRSLYPLFGKSTIENGFEIKKNLVWRWFIRQPIQKKMYFLLYIFLSFCTHIYILFQLKNQTPKFWDQAASTK